MRSPAFLALGVVAIAACSSSSPGPLGSTGDDGGSVGDGASSTKDGEGNPPDAQEDGGHDGGATDGGTTDGGAADVGVPHDSGGGHDSAMPIDAACTPFCGSAVCGDDGCGGSCGTCPGQYTCVINGTCQLDPGSVCGPATCGSAASCCHCNGTPTCFALPPGELCTDLGAGCM